jgi:hypothetical protein
MQREEHVALPARVYSRCKRGIRELRARAGERGHVVVRIGRTFRRRDID